MQLPTYENLTEQGYQTLLGYFERQIADRDTTIAALKTELSPAINEITSALMSAGLLAWGNRATITDPSVVLPLVLQLNQAAIEPRSVTQCDRIKGLFVTICQRSGVVPTPDEAQAMQSILDVGPPSTGPIASKYLSFEPWL
jgi:hypothetical protein